MMTKQANDTTERKCLAKVWSELMLRPYLEENRFAIRIDEELLKWILDLAEATGRLARCRLRLSNLELNEMHLQV